MTDEFESIEELTNQLAASPALLKSWGASCQAYSSYAWHVLNNSWQLSPEIPRHYIPHNPRLRLWDDAQGWTDELPYTMTVFRGMEKPTICRHAIWHNKQRTEGKKRLINFMNDGGKLSSSSPM